MLKTLFLFKEKLHRRENSLLYLLFLTRNGLIIKIFHILRLTALDIDLSVVPPSVMFVHVFYNCMIPHGLCMGFLIDIYVHIFIAEKKRPRCARLFYMTLLCTLLIYYIYESDVSRENLCYYFGM